MIAVLSGKTVAGIPLVDYSISAASALRVFSFSCGDSSQSWPHIGPNTLTSFPASNCSLSSVRLKWTVCVTRFAHSGLGQLTSTVKVFSSFSMLPILRRVQHGRAEVNKRPAPSAEASTVPFHRHRLKTQSPVRAYHSVLAIHSREGSRIVRTQRKASPPRMPRLARPCRP
jgi:hypothetical protein